MTGFFRLSQESPRTASSAPDNDAKRKSLLVVFQFMGKFRRKSCLHLDVVQLSELVLKRTQFAHEILLYFLYCFRRDEVFKKAVRVTHFLCRDAQLVAPQWR